MVILSYENVFAYSPSTISGAEDFFHHDQNIPLIPITPIEDEDAVADMFDPTTVNGVHMNLHPQQSASGASSSWSSTVPNPSSAHAVPAAEVNSVDPVLVAALTAFLSNNNQGSLIDRGLLIKLLSDPKMVEQLRSHAAAASAQTAPASSSSTQNLPVTTSIQSQSAWMTGMQNRPNQAMSLAETAAIPISRTDQHLAQISRPEAAAAPSGVFYPSAPNMRPMVLEAGSAPSPSPSNGPSLVTKDTSYYKSLILQHGEERQETAPPPQFGNRGSNHQLGSMREQSSSNNSKSRDMMKPKIMKPCIYFNSSRGCRNGANCAYQHDSAASQQQRVSGGGMPDSQSAKRMKMDREITGT